MTLILAMEAVYSTTEKDRTFFVADLSRLRQEGDTLVNAMVVYSPEADLKRVRHIVAMIIIDMMLHKPTPTLAF